MMPTYWERNAFVRTFQLWTVDKKTLNEGPKKKKIKRTLTKVEISKETERSARNFANQESLE